METFLQMTLDKVQGCLSPKHRVRRMCHRNQLMHRDSRHSVHIHSQYIPAISWGKTRALIINNNLRKKLQSWERKKENLLCYTQKSIQRMKPIKHICI